MHTLSPQATTEYLPKQNGHGTDLSSGPQERLCLALLQNSDRLGKFPRPYGGGFLEVLESLQKLEHCGGYPHRVGHKHTVGVEALATERQGTCEKKAFQSHEWGTQNS